MLRLDGVTLLPNNTIDLAVGPGVTVLLGPNGAGKTELMTAIMGLRRPEAGTIRLDGIDIGTWPPERRARAGIGWCPEGRRVFPGLSVAENLEAVAPGDAAARRRRRDRVLAELPMLVPKLAAPAWTLSGGQQQMLAIGRALMTEPRLLLLDEPSRGLAPVLVAELMALLRRLADQGLAVLLAEQAVAAALAVADQAVVLAGGRVMASGPAAIVRDDPALLGSFLG